MESDGSIEDGEIVDYTPLERPPTTIQKNSCASVAAISSDEASPASSDSEDESDTEPNLGPKKQKVNKKRFRFTNNKSSNKYNIWSIGLQEEALSQDLVNCGVDKINNSRDVETYDYQIKHRLNYDPDLAMKDEDGGQLSFQSNKRRYGESGNRRHIRQRSKDRNEWHQSRQSVNQLPVLELAVSESDSSDIVSKDISTKLSETKEDLICRIVNMLGNRKAIEIFNETKRIEDDGGMLIMNGSRRRTPGGVYLLLVKKDPEIPHDVIKKIFIDDKEMTQQFRKNKRKTAQVTKINPTVLSEDLLPNLLTRAELELNEASEAIDGEHAVSNPPPSPATDCDNSDAININSQQIITYDDDFLQLNGVDDDFDCF